MDSHTDNGRWASDDGIVEATAALSRASTLLRRSFLGLLGLLFSSAVLVYLISPRRDPSFIYTSSNAGSQVPWAAAIPEATWIQGVSILAALLATNIVLMLLIKRPETRASLEPIRYPWLAGALKLVIASMMWAMLAYAFWVGMAIYLIRQAIID